MQTWSGPTSIPASRIRSRRCATAGTSSRPPSSQAERGLKAELEEVAARGDRVMVVVRTPGVDGYRTWKDDDRNYAVFTVREGRIVALRDCRDRGEAIAAAAIE